MLRSCQDGTEKTPAATFRRRRGLQSLHAHRLCPLRHGLRALRDRVERRRRRPRPPAGRGLSATARGASKTSAPSRRSRRLFAADAIREIAAHLGGDLRDFLGVPLDLSSVGDFARRVYAAARTIPAGRTATYGEIAERAGAAGRGPSGRPGARRQPDSADHPVPSRGGCQRRPARLFGARRNAHEGETAGARRRRSASRVGVRTQLAPGSPRRSSRIPFSPATMTSVAIPQKSPCSTIPARAPSLAASAAGSAIGPKEQSKIQLP